MTLNVGGQTMSATQQRIYDSTQAQLAAASNTAAAVPAPTAPSTAPVSPTVPTTQVATSTQPVLTADQLAAQDKIDQTAMVEQPMKEVTATGKEYGLETGPDTIQGMVDKLKSDQATEKTNLQKQLDAAKNEDQIAAAKFNAQAEGAIGATKSAYAQGREGAVSGGASTISSEFTGEMNKQISENKVRLQQAQDQRDLLMTQLDAAQKAGQGKLAESISKQLSSAQQAIQQNKINYLNTLDVANKTALASQESTRQNVSTFTGMVNSGATMTPGGISSMAKTLNIPFDTAFDYYQAADDIRKSNKLSLDEQKTKLDDLNFNFNEKISGIRGEQAQAVSDFTKLQKSGNYSAEQLATLATAMNIPNNMNQGYLADLALKTAQAKKAELDAKYAYTTPPVGTKDYLEYKKAELDLQIAEADNSEFTGQVPDTTVKDIFYQEGKSDYGHGEGKRECGEGSNDIIEGKKVGNTYASKMAVVTKRSNPQVGNQFVIPLAPGGGLVKNNNTDPGHIETVIQTNPLAGTFKTVSWNRDGNGTQTIQSYNMDDLGKYGTNWGFSDSKLKSSYASKLSEANSQDSSVSGSNTYKDLFKKAKDNGLENSEAKKWATDQTKKQLESGSIDAPDLGSLAKGLANYDIDPKDISSRLPAGASESERAKVIKMAMDLNPTYSAGNFAAKKATIDSWSGAPTPNTYAFANNAANTAIKHLGTLSF